MIKLKVSLTPLDLTKKYEKHIALKIMGVNDEYRIMGIGPGDYP